MTQALYAHMNNKIKLKKKRNGLWRKDSFLNIPFYLGVNQL
jgi:hypothetical protein